MCMLISPHQYKNMFVFIKYVKNLKFIKVYFYIVAVNHIQTFKM